MKRSSVFLLHLGYWLIYLLLLLVIFSIIQIQFRKTVSFPTNLFLSPVGVSCIVPNLFAFYLAYFLLFPRFLVKRRRFYLVIFGALACLASALLGSFVLGSLYGFDQPVFSSPGEFAGLTTWMFLVACINAGIALVIRGFITWHDERKLKEELQQKNREMEMALIRSQLDPHFLFNTINNIDVLIGKDAARASEYLNKLSDIMRYMVYETRTEKIALSEELAYVEKYLELQKIRTSNPAYVSCRVKGDPGGRRIAPMLFFPFIENAFKHTEDGKSVNSIDIGIEIENEKLVFECANSYRKGVVEEKEHGGLGSELIKKRLELLYGKRQRLEVDDKEGIYKVRLSLDLYED
jgi:two-component system LytT family sensor kinase